MDDHWGDEPPMPELVKCEHVCGCNNCDRPTVWRARTFDIHVCSPECYDALKEALECVALRHEDGELVLND